MGLERTSITNIELGKQRLGIHTLYRFCEYFEILITDLLPSLAGIAKAELPPEAARALEQIRSTRR